jgi:hypothetical protein
MLNCKSILKKSANLLKWKLHGQLSKDSSMVFGGVFTLKIPIIAFGEDFLEDFNIISNFIEQ